MLWGNSNLLGETTWKDPDATWREQVAWPILSCFSIYLTVLVPGTPWLQPSERPRARTIHLRCWGQEEKGTTEDEMAGWHHWLNGCESQWTPGVDDGHGGLECCDSWGRKESDMTEWLIWSDRYPTCMYVWSVMFNFLWSYGLQPTRLLCPWDSPGKNIEVGFIPSSRGSSWPRKWTYISCVSDIASRFFTHWATWEAQICYAATDHWNTLSSSFVVFIGYRFLDLLLNFFS